MKSAVFLSALYALAVNAATFKATAASAEFPGLKNFDGTIEGASVDPEGRLFAVDKFKFGALAETEFFKINSTTSHFAASRFTKKHGVLVGDAVGHEVKSLTLKGATAAPRHRNRRGSVPYYRWREQLQQSRCKQDEFRQFGVKPAENNTKVETFVPAEMKLLQPNDMAVSPDERFVYFSGAVFQTENVAGKDGEIAILDTVKRRVTKLKEAELVRLQIFRTNGIEVSPDGKKLYVTSAQNVKVAEAAVVKTAKIFVFDIRSDGTVANGKQFADLKEIATALGVAADLVTALDPDGMRTTQDGSIFVTANAAKAVIKINPSTGAADLIQLDSVINPSNLEFGGKDGKTMFVVGRCDGGKEQFQKACVDKFQVDSPGRAFTNLQCKSRQ